MSKNQNVKDIVETEDAEDNLVLDLYDDEITDEDYGFVLGPTGELKSVFMPAEYFEIPEKVRAVFKAFGIDDPDNVHLHSVH